MYLFVAMVGCEGTCIEVVDGLHTRQILAVGRMSGDAGGALDECEMIQ